MNALLQVTTDELLDRVVKQQKIDVERFNVEHAIDQAAKVAANKAMGSAYDKANAKRFSAVIEQVFDTDAADSYGQDPESFVSSAAIAGEEGKYVTMPGLSELVLELVRQTKERLDDAHKRGGEHGLNDSEYADAIANHNKNTKNLVYSPLGRYVERITKKGFKVKGLKQNGDGDYQIKIEKGLTQEQKDAYAAWKSFTDSWATKDANELKSKIDAVLKALDS